MSKKFNQDPRVRRTRRLLQSTLQALLTEKKFDQITVSEIVRRAEVARTTFYAHFESKEQLLSSLREEVDTAFLAELDAQLARGDVDLEALARVLFQAMRDAGPLLQFVEGANLELLILEQTKRSTGHTLERLRLFEGISEWELMPYLDDAITGVLFMVTCRWVRDGMVLPAETVAKLFAEYAMLTRQIDLKRFHA